MSSPVISCDDLSFSPSGPHSAKCRKSAKAIAAYCSNTRSGVMPSRAARAAISSRSAAIGSSVAWFVCLRRALPDASRELPRRGDRVAKQERSTEIAIGRHRRAQFRQCGDLVSHRSGFVNVKMRFRQSMCDSKMRFEGAEGGDQDARGGFLTDPTPAPAPLQGPFLERALPAEDVPEARPRRRREPADRLDRAPHRRARRLDALCGAIAVGPRAALAEPQMRQVEGAK